MDAVVHPRASRPVVCAAIALALGYYWPAITAGWPRAALLVGVTSCLACINVRGIRQSAWVVNALTIGKLVPLAHLHRRRLVWFIDPAQLVHAAADHCSSSCRRAALLLIFIFGGYEVVPVPPARRSIRGATSRSRMVMTIVIGHGR